jgi:futalosine hydrolase
MKILIVSATEKEILPLKNRLKIGTSAVCVMKYTTIKDFSVDFLVAGIGSTLTTYALTKKLSTKKYDFVINTGIAGSFNENVNIGDIVQVQTDEFADLGIEDKNEFFTLFDKGFMKKDQFPFTDGKLINPTELNLSLKQVSGITVNTTHGNKNNIELIKNKFNADIETMEGAAFFYVCLIENIKCLQIRAISNFVEERNNANWDIPLAIHNLNEKLFDIIDVIKKNKGK